MPQQTDALVWMDLEMTGLDPESDRIIEMATIITDGDLRTIAEGPVLVIHQPTELLDNMDEWNTRTHNKTGLVNKVKASRVTERQAEIETLDFIQRHTLRNRAPLCGNSICQDRRFLYKYMPELSEWLHYRNVDVSSFKEVARHWAPSILAGFEKRASHQALDDIKESIEELRYYRNNLILLDTN
ncbi:MAG: oligoribonuclease [Gammaproteobacteria bacterium]|nr:oligoribonuclease [Gammaproteobacteria bacterium]